MTALKLDARPPVIAIAGAFNPAIFNPLWVAHHLHGFPKGAEVTMLEAVAEVPGGLAKLTFIEGVALSVSATRLDAIVLSHEAPRLAALEKVLKNLFEVLPILRSMASDATCSLWTMIHQMNCWLFSILPRALRGITSRTDVNFRFN